MLPTLKEFKPLSAGNFGQQRGP